MSVSNIQTLPLVHAMSLYVTHNYVDVMENVRI